MRLRVPVRVFEGDFSLSGLKKESFKLFINESRKEIFDIVKRKKSIGRIPELGRNIILSFHLTEFSKQLKNGISFLITELLSPADTLFVISPLRILRFKVLANKEGMVREVTELLEKDCNAYTKERLTAEKTFLKKIKSMTSMYGGGFFSNFSHYHRTLSFIDTLPRELLGFKENFLLPSIAKYRQVTDLLNFREGERYWIHFQDHAILYRLRTFFERISSYIRYLNWHPGAFSELKQRIVQAENQLLTTGAFSEKQFLNTLIRGDIGFNIFLLGISKSVDANMINTMTENLEGMLERISVLSGGIVLKANKLEQCLLKIKDHVDHYYDLVFNFNGKIEEKKIRVELPEEGKERPLAYQNSYGKAELTALLHYLAEEKIKIDGFIRKGKLIRFSIKSYKLNSNGDKKEGEDFGLVKVVIELVDQQGESVYKHQNILRATKDFLNIRLPLPVKEAGKFKLSITAYDLTANSMAALAREITL